MIGLRSLLGGVDALEAGSGPGHPDRDQVAHYYRFRNSSWAGGTGTMASGAGSSFLLPVTALAGAFAP
ncbi:hypothetical protein ABT297_07435 [Dactylosporangium sp. NPDC000555]|uniref:hypothetical protein n=1 Tax=Dactylosporangium sp. NPDC000555 TaxID=3154260 RepID=UPI00332B96ED